MSQQPGGAYPPSRTLWVAVLNWAVILFCPGKFRGLRTNMQGIFFNGDLLITDHLFLSFCPIPSLCLLNLPCLLWKRWKICAFGAPLCTFWVQSMPVGWGKREKKEGKVLVPIMNPFAMVALSLRCDGEEIPESKNQTMWGNEAQERSLSAAADIHKGNFTTEPNDTKWQRVMVR